MIHYKKKDNGKNDWVVFIHPLGGSSVTYYKQLKDFQKDFNLLLIDLHGHGKSIKTITGMKPNEIAQDIIDIIDKDTVCESNLNRQIIALHSTIGRDKVDVLKKYL